MGRYMKYMEIVNKMDELLGSDKGKKLLEGGVTPQNLDMLKTILCIQKDAFAMGRKIDFVDDMVKVMAKMSDDSDPGSREMMGRMAMGGQSAMGGAPQGNDFRGGRADPWAETGLGGGPATRFRQAQGRAYGHGPLTYDTYSAYDAYDLVDAMRSMIEEDRQGVPGTGRRRTRSTAPDTMDDMDFPEEDRRGRSARTGRYTHRSAMDDMDGGRTTDFWAIPGTWPSVYGRMGYGADPYESNRMYNNGGGQTTGGLGGFQLPGVGLGGNGGGTAATSATGKTMATGTTTAANPGTAGN